MGEALPDELTLCEARQGEPHLATYRAGHRECMWCKRPLDTCCEGEAGREEPPAPARQTSLPAHQIGAEIARRYDAGEYQLHPRGSNSASSG